MSAEHSEEGVEPPDCDKAGLDRAEEALKEAGAELQEARTELDRAEQCEGGRRHLLVLAGPDGPATGTEIETRRRVGQRGQSPRGGLVPGVHDEAPHIGQPVGGVKPDLGRPDVEDPLPQVHIDIGDLRAAAALE